MKAIAYQNTDIAVSLESNLRAIARTQRAILTLAIYEFYFIYVTRTVYIFIHKLCIYKQYYFITHSALL